MTDQSKKQLPVKKGYANRSRSSEWAVIFIGIPIYNLEPKSLAELCINRNKLSGVLASLKEKLPAIFQPFDWEKFDGSLAETPVIVEPNTVVIAEGTYTAHPDIKRIFDICILVTATDTERQKRLIVREGSIGEWERQWHLAEDWYFDNLAPNESFDIIVDNN